MRLVFTSVGMVIKVQHKKKYQVFISSTFTDLQEERRQVQDVVLKMNHFPVGMELFSAASEGQWSIIQKTINSSDYYVLIVGFRYGSETDDGISYTQKEYEYARENDIPILAFLKQDGIPSTPDERESSRVKQRKLHKFIDEVKKGRLVEWWSNKGELGQKVMNSLYKEFDTHPRPGWVRADSGDIEEIQLELVRQNKKIRGLEEENSTLKAQISSRIPTFRVLINDLDCLELQLPEWLGENLIRSEYMPVDIEAYRAAGISEDQIQKYNNSLPDEKAISDYIEAQKCFELSKDHTIPITISIENTGTAKANSVLVELEFPDSLIIYDQDSLDDLVVPEKPPRAKLPEEERMEHILGISKLVSGMHSRNYLAPMKSPKFAKALLGGYDENTAAVKGNTLHIRRHQIMHTRCTVLSGYYVVPLKAGEFEIKVSIICEEIQKKQEFTLPAVIR